MPSRELAVREPTSTTRSPAPAPFSDGAGAARFSGAASPGGQTLGSALRMAQTLLTTALHGRHAALGARLVPFAGWEMPVQYQGIREEHRAVREHAGVFDVSHMGEIETSGPQAAEFLQHLLSNDVRRIPEGGAQYAVAC